MPAPRFVTTNNFGAPGVYVRELKPQAGVTSRSINIIGIAGTTVRGPVDRAVRVNTFAQFTEVFGGRDLGNGGPIRSEIWKALVGKLFGPLVIARVAAADATIGRKDISQDGTPVLRIAASSPGAWANGLRVTVGPASDGDAAHFNVEAAWNGQVQVYRNLDISADRDNLGAAVAAYGDSALLQLSKLADGRPDDAVDIVLDDVAGSDGTLDDSHFTSTGGPIERVANYGGIKAVFVAGRASLPIKAKLATLAASSHDRVFLVCPDSELVPPSTAIIDKQSLSPSDRLVYCFNHTKIFDPETAEIMMVEPHSWMASILSQIDDDVHPGDIDNAGFTAAIVELAVEYLVTADYDQFTENGIAALERTPDGVVFADAPSTDGQQLAYRLMRDFLIRSIAARVNDDVKKANTQQRRDKTRSDIEAFLSGLARDERFVDSDENGNPQVDVDTETRNTPQSRADGVQRTLVQVRLLPFNLIVVLEVLIGTSVQVREVG